MGSGFAELGITLNITTHVRVSGSITMSPPNINIATIITDILALLLLLYYYYSSSYYADRVGWGVSVRDTGCKCTHNGT